MQNLIRSFSELEALQLVPTTPVVTRFSGGLDSTYLLFRLRKLGLINIHAVSVDVGGIESHAGKSQIAEALGVTLHSVDAKSEFVSDYVAPAIRAHAVYLDTHPISSSLSRPLIAKTALAVANSLDSGVILHTANRSQNTLRRLNGSLSSLHFGGSYGSPYDLEPVDRETKVDELSAYGLDQMAKRVVSGDSNLWCREYESGFLDDPENHVMEQNLYTWTEPTGRNLTDETIRIGFEHGLPISINEKTLSLEDIIEKLNVQVGRFGYGRYSGLEHLDNGQKVFELREMPAAWILLKTARHLETATLSAPLIREKMIVEQAWVTEALEGRWFGPARVAAQAFVDACSDRVDGVVAWNVSERSVDTVSISASRPLYIRSREDWESTSILRERAPYSITPLHTMIPVDA